MAENIEKRRVWTKVDTLENWNNNPLLLGPGEMALVTTPSGIPLNMKWGDKNERKRFSDLPFAISYDQGQFVAIDGPGALPTPESEVAYSLVGPGTYTYPGQEDIVVNDGVWGQVVYNDGEWSFVDMGELPEYSATGRIALGQDKAPSGQQAYLDLFDTGQVDLKSLFLNKGKLYPFKNYYGYSSVAMQRFLKAMLDVTLYSNDTENNKYTISQISVNDPGSGNRIDVTRKPMGGGSPVTYSFRTIGTSEDNSEANDLQLSKLVSGDLVNISLVPKDNSFKLELIADTSEFASSEQINLYLSPQWDDFVFEDSVYRKYEVSDLNSKIGDIEERMPVKFSDTGVTLDLADQGILKSDGSYFSSSSSRSSSIMDIPNNELYVSGRMAGNSATLIAFYDSQDNFVGTQFESNGTAFNVERELVVPVEGATRIAFNSYNSGVFLLETVTPDDVASQGQIDQVNQEISLLNNDVTDLDIRVTDLEQSQNSKITKALNWERAIEDRKSKLNGEYLEKVLTNPNYEAPWYGVEWNEGNSNPNAVTRRGSSLLHQIDGGLPIQSKIRRCVVKNGVVQYYLNSDDSNFKEDGVTPAILDGTDGDVMVEVPEFFYKTEDLYAGGLTKRISICEEGIIGWNYSPKYYLSAYQSTVDRLDEKLASVCSVVYNKTNEDLYILNDNNYSESDSSGFSLGTHDVYEIDSYTANAARYRGNVNDASLDGETNPVSQNYSRNNLGRPVANINRKTARKYAENGNTLIQQYDGWKSLYYLIMVEYATRDLQQPVISEPDANGFRQGGLGKGATQYPDYGSYEKYFSPQGGTAVLPNGITNELGNNSGEVYFRIKNVPVESTGSGSSAVFTQWGDVLMPVNSYRGIENIFGQLYEIIDNVDVLIEGLTYPLKRNTYFYQPNPYLTNDSDDKSDYVNLGTYDFNSSIHVITSLKWGDSGHILPIASGTNGAGAYLNYYCAAVEHTQAWNGNIANKIKYYTKAGRIVSKTLVDLLFSVAVIDVDSNRARTSDTVRHQLFIF